MCSHCVTKMTGWHTLAVMTALRIHDRQHTRPRDAVGPQQRADSLTSRVDALHVVERHQRRLVTLVTRYIKQGTPSQLRHPDVR